MSNTGDILKSISLPASTFRKPAFAWYFGFCWVTTEVIFHCEMGLLLYKRLGINPHHCMISIVEGDGVEDNVRPTAVV